MDREEFKFQMYLQMMRLRAQAKPWSMTMSVGSEKSERALYDGGLGKAWAPYLDPLATQAGF
jgi:hypothetical protein